MLCFDLTVTFMIMINALLINQSSAAKEIVQRGRSPFSSQVPLEHQGYFREKNDSFRFSPSKNARRNRRMRNGHRRNWYLDPIIIKLENVIGKYDLKRGELEALYSGVVGCGNTGCESFKDLIPKNQQLNSLKCSGTREDFKKKIRKILSTFQKGVKKVEESFQILIEFEKLPRLNNGSRRKILEELKTDMKTLRIELEDALTNKRLTFRLPKSSFPPRPQYRTHLLIYEWRIIRETKKFLQDWEKNLHKIFKCWRKIKQTTSKKNKVDKNIILKKLRQHQKNPSEVEEFWWKRHSG